MISHMKHKPNKEKMLDTINQAAKIEFDFLMNGLNADLIEVTGEEIIQLIDKNTKALKLKVIIFERYLILRILNLGTSFKI
jgi:hypothetical protein